VNQKHDQTVDVLFVNPPSPDRFVYIRDINRHGRSSWERMIWPQTNLAYLAAVAGELGLSADIVDCIAESISWPDYENILRRTKPRYCFSNIISATYSNDVRALQQAKDISAAVTVGMGPHITDSPERTLEEAQGLDFVICHEAEATLAELLRVYEQESPPTIDRLNCVAGIGFVPGRIVPGEPMTPIVTEQRPFISDMDSLPRPRHDLLPLNKYWAPFLGNYTFVEASRGCTYRCIFCRQAVMWQWQYRKRSGKAIAEEALYVHSLGVKNILFHADTFTLDSALVEELCATLIAAGSPLRWACNTHVLNIIKKPELVPMMKQAGCWMIAVGIESGDDQVLRNIKKGITAAQARTAVQIIDRAGIEAWGYFVLGFPGDTKETLAKTTDFALSLPLKMAKFDIAAPYPGTEFHRYVKEHDYLKISKYEDYDQDASAVVEYDGLSRAEIKRAVQRSTRRFYFRPRMIPRILKEMLKPMSFISILFIARDFFLLLSSKLHSSEPENEDTAAAQRRTNEKSSCC